jgi:hypothetical protein
MVEPGEHHLEISTLRECDNFSKLGASIYTPGSRPAYADARF